MLRTQIRLVGEEVANIFLVPNIGIFKNINERNSSNPAPAMQRTSYGLRSIRKSELFSCKAARQPAQL